MNKYKRKLEEQHFWSTMLYERADSLKTQLSAMASVPTGIASHNNGASTPSHSATALAGSAAPETKEGPRGQRRARRALFIEK